MSFLAQQILAAQPREQAPASPKPTKRGYCVRHGGEGQLRLNRIGASGDPVFNNYCEDCHRSYMKEYRKIHFVGRVRVSRPVKRSQE